MRYGLDIYNSGYMIYMDLRTNSNYFLIQHLKNAFCNGDGICLLRGTDCIYIYIILRSALTV